MVVSQPWEYLIMLKIFKISAVVQNIRKDSNNMLGCFFFFFPSSFFSPLLPPAILLEVIALTAFLWYKLHSFQPDFDFICTI